MSRGSLLCVDIDIDIDCTLSQLAIVNACKTRDTLPPAPSTDRYIDPAQT